MARRFTMFLMGVLALAIAFTTHPPAAQDAEGDGCAEGDACAEVEDDGAYGRRKICEGWGGTLKNYVRVAYAKTGDRPVTLSGRSSNGGCELGEGSLGTRHGAVIDRIYGVKGDDDGAAMIIEEIVGGAYGLFVFNLADGNDEWYWYDSLEDLKESHDSVDIDLAEPTPDPDIQLLGLYNQPGRKWTHRVVEWRRDATPHIQTVETEVGESSDGFATWSATGKSEFVRSETRADGEFRIEAPPLRYRIWADRDLPVETVATDAGEFECRKHRETAGGIQTTTWVSTEYHPLVVKQVKLGKDFTEIRKLEKFYAAEVDPWLLFRKVGRKFTYSGTSEGESVSARVTVLECTEDSARIEVVTTDDNQQDIEIREISFDKHLLLVNPEGVEQISTSESRQVDVKAGTFACFEYSDDESVQYYSRVWAELPVKLVSDEEDAEIELTSFDLGHDMREFYGTVGNYYVMESRSEFGGMQTVSTMRYEVVEVLEGKARIKFANFDANGNEVFSQDMEMPIPGLKPPGDSGEDDQGEGEEGKKADGGEEEGEGGDESEAQDEPAPVTPYTGQVEEWITTPAGSFAAIRTEIEMDDMESVTWTWNGLAMRSESHSPDFSSVSEIIELHME